MLAPITYQEIEAYDRLTGASLEIWQVKLLRRIDDAVRQVSMNKGKGPPSISDVKGSLRAAVAARAAAKAAKGEPSGG